MKNRKFKNSFHFILWHSLTLTLCLYYCIQQTIFAFPLNIIIIKQLSAAFFKFGLAIKRIMTNLFFTFFPLSFGLFSYTCVYFKPLNLFKRQIVTIYRNNIFLFLCPEIMGNANFCTQL